MGHGIVKGYDWVFSGNEMDVWHGYATLAKGLKCWDDVVNSSPELRKSLGFLVGKQDIWRWQPASLSMVNSETLRDALTRCESLAAVLRAAGVPVQIGIPRAIKAHAATVNLDLPEDDPCKVLGIVGRDYQEFQNAACAGLLDRVIGAWGGAHYETAGTLEGNSKLFMSASVPANIRVKDDVIVPYLMLYSAHDGSGAVEIKYVLGRPVCKNTVAAARAENTYATAKVRHSAGNADASGNFTTAVVQQVQDTIGQRLTTATAGDSEAARIIAGATSYFSEQQRIFNKLAETEISADFVNKYLRVIVPDDIKGEQRTQTRRDNRRQAIANVYYGTQPGDRENMEAIRIDRRTGASNAYRLYQSVTYADSHLFTSKLTTDKMTGLKKSPAEARLSRLLETGDNVLRVFALDALQKGIDTGGEWLNERLIDIKEKRERVLTAKLLSVSATDSHAEAVQDAMSGIDLSKTDLMSQWAN